ncbi:MAG: GSCFA domain-containing protein, partial [Bacteroidales bacterium]|nr:GSCFA domain-containing protein [Bacteroidales bacterium]
MTDDLRDYRFYASDRIHPSEEAVHYIWDVFSETYFSEGTRMLNRSVEEITAAFRHRTAFPELGAYRSFCRRSLDQIHALQREHPDLDFSQEERYFSAHADS